MSDRQLRVRNFRDSIRKPKRPCPHADFDGADGLFSLFSDDVVMLVLAAALAINASEFGLAYFETVDTGAICVLAMARSCRRLSLILHNCCPELRTEALSRMCTRVRPQDAGDTLAFTRQMKSELLSCDQLRIVKGAQNAMALHCSKDCCRNARRAFNKDVKKGRVLARPSSPGAKCAPSDSQVVPVTDNCSLQHANEDGSVVFAYIRERLSKVAVHGDERGRRFRNAIVRFRLDPYKLSFARTSILDIDSATMSEPLEMKTSPCGEFVAFIRAIHEIDADAALPLSAAFIWNRNWREPYEIKPWYGGDVMSNCLSAQNVWYRTNECGDAMVVVAWSTELFHSSGHFVGSSAPDSAHSQYLFSSYSIDASDPPDHWESTFSEYGALLTCSPCCGGNKVLTLSKRRDVASGFRCVYMNDLAMSSSYAVSSTYVDAGPKGPVAASVSPNGDCVVVVCKTSKSILTTVAWQTSDSNYTPIGTLDITPWLGLYSNHETMFDSDLVKASVDIQFSSCSRFFAVVDRHPLFGARPEGHGVVVVDTAMRGKTTKMRAFPLFQLEDQAPRGFQWAQDGIFLLPPGTDEHGALGPKGGSLCVYAPTGTGFV